MTVIALNAPSFFNTVGKAITSFFTHLIENSAMARSAEARRQLMESLYAKTDAELAEMHLSRDSIPAYVFRDLMYI